MRAHKWLREMPAADDGVAQVLRRLSRKTAAANRCRPPSAALTSPGSPPQLYFGISSCVTVLDLLQRNKTEVKMVVSIPLYFDSTNVVDAKLWQFLVADYNALFKKLYNRPQ
jgi:hypothetical protein